MSLARLRTGEWIAGLAGILLFLSLFLNWYEHTMCLSLNGGSADCIGTGHRLDAWQAFSVTDLVLAAAGLSGIVAAVLTAANSKPDAPITWEAGTVLVALLAALLAVYRVLDPPDDLERCYGLYIGLIAAVAVLVGLFLAERDEYAGPG